MNRAKLLLGMAVASLGGLCLMVSLYAGEKPEAKKDKPASSKDPMPMRTAVKPKPLSEAVKKGLKYLVSKQHANGGWGQGGGWRTQTKGGRIQGANVADPADVGNTAIALLALVRAGNTMQEGTYAENVAKGVAFICGHIEKSDNKSLFITDVKGTQIQSKIGPYVDTFLSSMVLSELKITGPKGKPGKRLIAALNKTVGKMEKNQRKDGTFAGNTGWASVLSQGLANKGLNYAAQRGVVVGKEAIDRVGGQVAANFDAKSGKFKPAAGGGVGGGPGRGTVPATTPAAPSDAGVPLYQASSYLTNSADVINTYRRDAKKAQEILKSVKATDEEKKKAKATLAKVAKAEELRQQATTSVMKQLDSPAFVRGFGSNGGEEFLSHMNIGEALLLKGGKDFEKWQTKMAETLTRVQDKNGSWSGHHCITGKTFCTSAALLVLMVDRTPLPVEEKKDDKKVEKKK